MNAPQSPKVAVIIPCHRHGQFIGDAIASIKRQTFTDWQIVVVDDASVDETMGVVSAWQAEIGPERFLIIRQDQRFGPGASRNRGITESLPPLISFLDADDCFKEDFLQVLCGELDKNPEVSMVTCDRELFGNTVGIVSPPDYSASMLAAKNTLHMGCIIRRELWTTTGGFEPTLPWAFEDWDFWLSCSEAHFIPLVVRTPLLRQRVHDGATSSKLDGVEEELAAMVVTRHREQYDWRRIIQAQEFIIHNLSQKTRGELARLETIFSGRGYAPFWLGCAAEGRSDYVAARELYAGAYRALDRLGWQIGWREFQVFLKERDLARAMFRLQKLRESYPEERWLFDVVG